MEEQVIVHLLWQLGTVKRFIEQREGKKWDAPGKEACEAATRALEVFVYRVREGE